MKNGRLPIYPMHISYISKSPIWGGRKLRERFGKEAKLPTVGETWELTVRGDAASRILDGECAGMTLAEYIKKSRGAAVGEKYVSDGGDFPLLIKFIDAADELSVQVHPDDAYAARIEGGVGKTEMWYIVDAEPGAELVMGLCDTASPELLRASAQRGEDISPLLRRVPVKTGDSFFIPSGMVHAIGRGILIAEIQQNCDLTYRLWDYGRLGSDGRPRELHIDKACDVLRAFGDDEVTRLRYAYGRGDDLLAACEYFTVRLGRGGSVFYAGRESFASVLCFEGGGSIEWSGGSVSLKAGDSVFIPAGMGEYRIDGSARVLVSCV